MIEEGMILQEEKIEIVETEIENVQKKILHHGEKEIEKTTTRDTNETMMTAVKEEGIISTLWNAIENVHSLVCLQIS